MRFSAFPNAPAKIPSQSRLLVVISMKSTSIFASIFDLRQSDKDRILYDDILKQRINCEPEEIKGIVYKFSTTNTEVHTIAKDTVNTLVSTFSQDLIFFINSISAAQNKRVEINSNYINLHNNSLEEYLQNTDNVKNIVYTFTNCVKVITMKTIENSKLD